MSTSLNLKLDPEKIREMPMVDLAFMVLKAANTPYYYRDLMNEVAKLRSLSDEETNDVIAQLYTEINIDGRFAYVGTNLWGLKRWYPIDKAEDTVTGMKRPRIINDDDDEDEEYIDEEHEDEDFDHAGDEDEDDDLFDDDSDEDEDDVDEEIIGDEELDDDEEDVEDEDDELSDDEDEDEEV